MSESNRFGVEKSIAKKENIFLSWIYLAKYPTVFVKRAEY